jgi:PAS domain S-box-containing protein
MTCLHSRARQRTSRSLLVFTGLLASLLLWQGYKAQQTAEAMAAARTAEAAAVLRAQLVVLSAPAAIITCDDQRNITLVNPAAEELTGWTASQLLGQNLDVIIPVSLREQQRSDMLVCLEELRKKNGSWLLRRSENRRRVLRQNGEEVDVEVVVRAIRYHDTFEFIASFRKSAAPLAVPTSEPLPPLPVEIQQMSLK